MNCGTCRHWLRGTRTIFAGSEEWKPAGAGGDEGLCRGPVGKLTTSDFGCLRFAAASSPDDQVITVRHDAEPCQVFEVIRCPDCSGGGNSGEAGCHRCAGTGKVRRYGDGYVGDEQTREHPRARDERLKRQKEALAARMQNELAELERPPTPVQPVAVETGEVRPSP